MSRDDEFERGVVDYLAPHFGKTIAQLAKELRVRTPPEGVRLPKSFAAVVIRRLLDAGGVRSDLYQFSERHIAVKTVRVPPSGRPFESMSFPAFRASELMRESWETSVLHSQLERLFIVVLTAVRETTPIPRHCLRRAFFWSPTDEELPKIRREWAMYQAHIKRWGPVDLPHEKETSWIHVRPHGRDSSDLDLSAGPVAATRQSFWLNRSYVGWIIRPTRSPR